MPLSKKTTTSSTPIQSAILSLLNLDYVPDSQKEQLLDQMVDVIEQRVLLRSFQSLDQAKTDRFNDVLEKGTEEDVRTFVFTNIPNFLDILKEEVARLTIELKKFAGTE